MQKDFIKNIFSLLFINVLVKVLYIIFIDAEVQNRLGDSEYGIYFSLFNFCFLFQIILDLGIQNYNSKNIAQNRTSVETYFSYVLSTKLLLVFAFAVSLFIGAFILDYPPFYFKVITGIVIMMIVQSFFVYLRTHFSALGHFHIESRLSALDKMLMFMIIGYMLYVEREISVMRFISGQIVALSIALLITGFLLNKKFKLRLNFSLTRSNEIIKASFPYAIVLLVMTIYTRMDGVMLERMIDDNAISAGIYGAAYRLLDASNMVGYLFAMLLLPMFSNLISEHKNVMPLIEDATGLLVTLSTGLTVVCWFYGADIMSFMYVDITPTHVSCFKILMVSFWAISISYIYGALILSDGRLKTLNLVLLSGVFVNFSLNIWLIPQQGATGAAIATLITQWYVLVWQFALAVKQLKLHFRFDYTIKLISQIAIFIILGYLISEYLTYNWVVETLLFAGLGLITSILLGFFRLSTILGPK